VTAD